MKAVEEEQQEIRKESSAFYEKAIVERNKKWMTQLRKILQQEQNAMVLVGVDHLGGQDGLLQSLTDAGYKVRQLYGIDRPQ